MKDRRVPYYLQLRDTIANQISSGTLTAHTKLPSERELTSTHNINRVTVRQALMQLESEGLIYRLLRRGWYVSPNRLIYNPTQDIGFMDNVRAQARVPTTVILSKLEVPASRQVANQLAVTENTPVFSLQRRRTIDDLSVLVERIHVNAQLCRGLLDIPLDRSLTNIFREHYNILISRTKVTMYPAPLNDTLAEELNVVAGTPGLFLARTSYDQYDNIIEYDEEYWRHDALEITIEVNNNIEPEPDT